MMYSSTDGKEESKETAENKHLKAQLQGLEILLKQNAALETEVKRLCDELDEATLGVLKRGYLYKWRDREISYAAKWGLRYFVLRGKSFSYYGDEHDNHARRTIDLSHCIVRSEGTKKNGIYHVFSIYLAAQDLLQTPESLLLRLSSESPSDAAQWVDMLEQACALSDIADIHRSENTKGAAVSGAETSTDTISHDEFSSRKPAERNTGIPHVISESDKFQDGWGNTAIDRSPSDNNIAIHGTTTATSSNSSSPLAADARAITGTPLSQKPILKSRRSSAPDLEVIPEAHDETVDLETHAAAAAAAAALLLPAKVINRMKSSENVLRQSMSRSSMAARSVLAKRAPNLFTVSGSRIDQLPSTQQQQHSRASTNKRGGGDTDVKQFPASKPMHVKSRWSPLSTDAGPGTHNYRGFFYLGFILLLLSHCRLIADNMMSYGFMLSVPSSWPWLRAAQTDGTCLPGESAVAGQCVAASASSDIQFAVAKPVEALLAWMLSLWASFLVELASSHGYLRSEPLIFFLHVLLSLWNIIVPTVWTWHSNASPAFLVVFMFQSVILWLKLISYAHANRDLRSTWRKLRKSDSPRSGTTVSEKQLSNVFADVKDLESPYLIYPKNINFPNLLYFCVAPTLTYQLNYPRSPNIRWRYVLTLVVRLIITFIITTFSVQQYIKPTLASSFNAMQNTDFLQICETLLKLSIPNTYIWLLVFYLYFHLWLNLLAELTRFGDRCFYHEWWNARTIDEYWRNWNLPVHYWMVRHLYHPLLRQKVPKFVATVMIFTLSAFLHEVVISVPFHTVSFHAFFGMLGQIPLTMISRLVDRTFDNAFIGNALFWVSFCIVGQPMGIMMYYYDLTKISTQQQQQQQ